MRRRRYYAVDRAVRRLGGWAGGGQSTRPAGALDGSFGQPYFESVEIPIPGRAQTAMTDLFPCL
jgi:hypothetical protein